MKIFANAKPAAQSFAGALLILIMTFAHLAQNAVGDNVTIPTPGPEDRCPVCGMFVAKFPAWGAGILYADGVVRHFDGPKDMFKYLLTPSRYEPQRQVREIKAIVVTEYYGLRRIDARGAFFVIGSDVLGPMGHELVPLASHREAREFLKDHKGSEILTFNQVDTHVLNTLNNGRFE